MKFGLVIRLGQDLHPQKQLILIVFF